MQDRETIRSLKTWLKEAADLQRDAKRRRKTGALPANYEEAIPLMRKSWKAQAEHSDRRFWITAGLILYGQLRERPHEVKRPKDYAYAVEHFAERHLEKQKAS